MCYQRPGTVRERDVPALSVQTDTGILASGRGCDARSVHLFSRDAIRYFGQNRKHGNRYFGENLVA